MAATRERILSASAELFRRKGYTGTGLKQIVAAADAPFGSLYHFFPGGKEQLGAEVIRWSGAMYLRADRGDLRSGARRRDRGARLLRRRAETLRETDYADACPIATVALEVASTSEPLREATAEVFESWIAAAAARFAAAGIVHGAGARAGDRRCSPRSRARSSSAARCAAPSRSRSPARQSPRPCRRRSPRSGARRGSARPKA